MRLAAFIIAVCLASTIVANAQSTGGNLDTTCKGYTGDPSGEYKLSESLTVSQVNALLTRVAVCPSACFDVTLRIGADTSGLKMNVSAQNRCTKQQDYSKIKSVQSKLEAPDDKRNCAGDSGLPSVTVYSAPMSDAMQAIARLRGYTIPQALTSERKEGPKSRCDPKIIQAISTFSAKSDAAIDNGFNSLSQLRDPSADTSISRGTIAGSEAITNAFNPDVRQAAAGALNTSDAERARIAGLLGATDTSNASSNRAFLQCIANGCSAEEYRNATDAVGFSLNDDTKTKIASLSPETLASPDGGFTVGEGSETAFGGGSTFGPGTSGVTDIDKAKCAIARIESGSCAGNYGAVGPVTRKGNRAYGKYQVMDFNIPSWTSGACGRAMTPGQFLSDGSCQERVFEKYFGQGVAQCGSYQGAASMWHSGKCNPGNSTDGWLSTSSYVGRFANSFAQGTVAFGSQAAPYVGGSSPFTNVNPFYTGTGYSVPTSYSVGGQTYGSAGGSPFSFLTGLMSRITGTNAGTSGSTGTSVPTQGTQPPQGATPPTPVGSIVAQPKEVAAGGSVLVSWTSVGVRSGTTCGVYLKDNAGEIQIAVGYGGSKSITATSTGALGLTLRCMFQGGVTLQQSTSVTVQ